MKTCLYILFVALAAAVMAVIPHPAVAQTVLLTPDVLVCPVPLWPAPRAACPKPAIFNPIATAMAATYAAGSANKTAPIWNHTYSGYTATDVLIACPAGAQVSADSTKCISGGADASALVVKSQIPAFMLKASQPVIPPIVPPPAIPATKDYSFSWGPPLTNLDGTVLTNLTGYLISNATSSIGPFLTWNMVGSGVTTYTYKALSTAIPQCFAIAGFSSSNGAGAPLVFCQPSLMTAPGPVTKVN